MHSTFSAYRLIREFRDLCNAAPELPDDTIISVTSANTEHSYYLSSAKKLAVKLGLFASVEDVLETYETTFGAVRDLGEEYLLSKLEDGQVAWTMVRSDQVTQDGQVALNACGPMTTLFIASGSVPTGDLPWAAMLPIADFGCPRTS